jgi:hypothetical protein
MDLGTVVDTLYGLPRDEFTPARDQLVKQARAAGERELATAIGKLRRPTVAAWAVNQLARHRPDELGALTELGSRLRAAHRELDGTALRELSVRRRELLAQLQRTAHQVAGEVGVTLSETVGRDIEEMFGAALAEEGSTRALVSGRLSALKELLEAGAGAGAGAEVGWPETAPGARPRPTLVRTDPGAGASAAPRTGTSRTEASRTEASRTEASGAGSGPGTGSASASAADAASGPSAALPRARAELDRARTAEAEAEQGQEDAERRYGAAAAEETEAHQLVARLRTELVAAEQAEQSARQRARFARRQRDDADRELRERRRRATLAQNRLTALDP